MKEVDLQEVTEASSTEPANIKLTAAFDQVEIALEVRIGSLSLNFGELKALTKGKALVLDQEIDEPVDLVLKGNVVARGKLTVVGDNFGIEIVETPS